MTLNVYQKKLLETYGDGDYAYLMKELNEDYRAIEQALFEDGGDTLVLFLLRELAGVEGKDDALSRMMGASNDIDSLIAQLEMILD